MIRRLSPASRSFWRRFTLPCVGLLTSAALTGQVLPQNEYALLNQVVAPAGFISTIVPEPYDLIAPDADPAVNAAVAAFRAQYGAEWRIYLDRRSGGVALGEGPGIPWAGGASRLPDLEARARSLMAAYPALFVAPSTQFALDPKASMNFGERNQYWTISFRQVFNGVPVEGARAVFRVSHGNLVQFGIDKVVPALAGKPGALLSRTTSRALLATYVGGFLAGDQLVEDGALLWVPRGAADSVGYTGAVGQGWTPTLVYRFTFTRAGESASWQGLVDARTGAVLRFVDASDYATGLVRGSVYTTTNCTSPANCVPGSQAESAVTLPFAQLTFTGGSCTGDACYSNSAGAFTWPAGATSATTTLTGKYFQIVDTCGAITASATATGNIDLGTSDPNPPINSNTDCAAATRQSPPNNGAATGGSGDTHSARNLFYHLNLINQKARFYLPANDWLKGAGGASGPVTVTADSAPACNAFWQGGTGTLNFQRVTSALFCNNTGEIPDVFLHEFGHGLDQNDGTGTAPESATGEAMGDTFAILEGQHSCMGLGFRLQDPTDVTWGNKAGYGNNTAGSASQSCSGVRDADYTRFCAHDAAGCLAGAAVALRDGDIVQGSHAGPSPNLSLPDAGTPARWNTMLANVPTVQNGQSNFYNCGGPETTGCAGPLNHGCHCESTIASQANWDLAKGLIRNEFGGNIYNAPQTSTEVSGWQYLDRLWYLTRDSAVSAYSVTGQAPTGTTNGCGISDWFSTYRFIDDDDGNLANGTPHADILFSAFDLHAMACGAAADPSNQGGSAAPPPAPVLAACAGKSPVEMSWSASAGATGYRVLRNTLGCGFGFKPVGVVSGGQTVYEDADVAPGNTYYYSVQPVGANPSNYGFASNCVSVTPTTCSTSAPAAPAQPTLSTPADNQIRVDWSAVSGAGGYKIYRKEGGCAAPGAFALVGIVDGGATVSYLDTSGLQGTFTYGYQVVSKGATCAGCESAPSACRETQASGSCGYQPSFAGVGGVAAAPQGQCRLNVSWNSGSAVCGSGLTYDVFRSTDPLFAPAAGNRVASGVATTGFSDLSVNGGVQYFYAVRARDGYGNIETNTVRRGETPVGSLTPGTYADDAGDTPTAKFSAGQTPGNAWSIRANGTANATKQYATTAAGNYVDNACQGLESNTIRLGTASTLSFRSRYAMENGWDGGYVEVATESGGFSNWTKLTTINYPAVMGGPAGTPACGGPGFADGQPVFTGTSAGLWQNYSGSLSAYNGQNIRIRFLFSSDGATNDEGWFIDDLQVSNAMLPGPCAGEVSSAAGGRPLRARKGAGNTLDFTFEDLGGSPYKYNLYEGQLGSFYSHTTHGCDAATTPASGERTLAGYAPAAGSGYFLVTASNGAAEGIFGFDGAGNAIPPPGNACGP